MKKVAITCTSYICVLHFWRQNCYIFILLGQVKGSLEVISQVLGLKGLGKNRLVNKLSIARFRYRYNYFAVAIDKQDTRCFCGYRRNGYNKV